MDKAKELDLRLRDIERRLDFLESEESNTISIDADQECKIDRMEAAFRRFLLTPGNPFSAAADAREILDGANPDELAPL